MGQGVNTKIADVVASTFGLSHSEIKIMPTSTEKNHNTSATAASSGSDINGAAAEEAAMKIKKRLASYASYFFDHGGNPPDPITSTRELVLSEADDTSHIVFEDGEIINQKQKNQRINFKKLVSLAYMNRISLGDYGYYRTPEIHYDQATGKGRPFLYYTHGAAVSEIVIDTFTGELKVLQTDILMDLGRPINEGIDYGQTIGGFVQGMGWLTGEDLRYNKNGKLMSYSPTTYKIPSIQDTPRKIQCQFFENPTQFSAVKGSKAVGEPPLLLANSVWTAVKNIIQECRSERVDLKVPASHEEILMHLWKAPEGNV